MDQTVNTMTRQPQLGNAPLWADQIPRSINAQIKVSKAKLSLRIR